MSDKDVIYLCNWCGWPCFGDGTRIEMGYDQMPDYLEAHKDAIEERVDGSCCPNGADDYIHDR